jgi:hypothetical protein
MRTTWLKDVPDGRRWLRRLAIATVLACLPLQAAVARMSETPRSFSLQDKSLSAVQLAESERRPAVASAHPVAGRGQP